MPRITDGRDRIHQPRYDALTRGSGQTQIPGTFTLFGSQNVGNLAKSNMEVPGQLASDATFMLKAIRCIMFFQSLNDPEFNQAFSPLAAITGPVATGARALDLYQICSYGFTFTLSVAGKQWMEGKLHYLPAGGGIAGFTTESTRSVVTNGVSSHEAVLFLGRDVAIAARQSFNVKLQSFPFEVLGVASGGATISSAVDPIAELNAFDGIKDLEILVDGIETRDIL